MISYDSYSDAKLIVLLKQNDEAAFTELYSRYWLDLYDTAYKRLKNREQIEDIIQDVFVKLWTRRTELSIEDVQAYLHTSIRFSILNYVERHLVHESFFEPFESIAFAASKADDKLLEKEVLDLIRAYIDALPRKRKQILLLRLQDDLSTKEIASRLNISQKTVQNQLGATRQNLFTKIASILFVLAAISFVTIL